MESDAFELLSFGTTLMGKPVYETTLSRDFPSDYDVYDRGC